MLEIIFEYKFMQYAIYTALLSSIVCGIIGVIIVEKKLVMMSGGIAHTSYGGVGLGYLLGFEPLIGAFIFSIGAAVGVGVLKKKGKMNSDAIIGMFWSLGMALGLLFIALMKGYPPDLNSYLFGNILFVTVHNLYLMLALTALLSFIILVFFQHWKAYLFDDEFVFVIGIKRAVLDFTLLILIAMSIVVLIRAVGIILVMALLTAPAATAGLFSNKLKSRMGIGIILSAVYCLLGLTISYYINIPSGASIVILAVISHVAALSFKHIFARLKTIKQQKTPQK